MTLSVNHKDYWLVGNQAMNKKPFTTFTVWKQLMEIENGNIYCDFESIHLIEVVLIEGRGWRGVGRGGEEGGEGEMTSYAHHPRDGQLGGAVCHQASDGGCRWSCGGRRVKPI